MRRHLERVYRRENTFEENKFTNKNKKRKMKKQQYHSKAEDKIREKKFENERDNCIDLFLSYLVVIGHVMLCGYLTWVSICQCNMHI